MKNATNQPVLVKLYWTPDRVTVAAPMPALCPSDITVEVTSRGRLVLHGERHGRLTEGTFLVWGTRPEAPHGTSAGPALADPEAETRQVLLDEWLVGPYHRELELPTSVDATLATATYGNGVLVVVLPRAAATRVARLTLEAIGPGYGQRVGSTGHPVRPLTTEEHLQIRRQRSAGRLAGGDQPTSRPYGG
jgi:HSP20 family molecular chaperone IbpA